MAMARSDERTPLLMEVESVDSYELRHPEQPARGTKLPAAPVGSKRRAEPEHDTKLVAVFVVTFDTLHGNTVEWSYPKGVDLEGVEFKSMASGLHHITRDFVYFKVNDYYGFSCFEKMAVTSVKERGARMKSVGVLASSYRQLHLHQSFLERQVRIQLEKPGEYGSLEEYLHHFHQHIARPLSRSQSQDDSQEILQSHPDNCFSHFLQYFGPHIFVLWKLALLQKRIIFYSAPPIGEVCHRVYCTSLLTAHDLGRDMMQPLHYPFFYVSVADIETLKNTRTYVACTTEKIFQMKPHLYDVFVDSSCRMHTQSQFTEPLLRVNGSDRARFEHLVHLRSSHLTSRVMSDGSRVEQDNLGFAEFFIQLNTLLFHTMMDAASCDDHVMTVEAIQQLGLDPILDHTFLSNLTVLYGFDMVVQRHHGYCCYPDSTC